MSYGGSITTPTQIAGLQLWYDASAATSANFSPVPTNGDLVQAWVDKLGNGRDANQSNSNKKPTWVSGQQNNNGAILFDGVNDTLTLNPISWSLSQPGVTMFLVAKASTLSGTPNITATNTNGYRFFWDSNWSIELGGGRAQSTIAGDTSNYHLFTAVFDGTQTDADITVQNNKRLKFRYDKVQRGLTFSTNANTTTSSSANTVNIGSDSNGTNYYNGYLGEMVIYTQTLNLAQIAAVENFLSTKWGI